MDPGRSIGLSRLGDHESGIDDLATFVSAQVEGLLHLPNAVSIGFEFPSAADLIRYRKNLKIIDYEKALAGPDPLFE